MTTYLTTFDADVILPSITTDSALTSLMVMNASNIVSTRNVLNIIPPMPYLMKLYTGTSQNAPTANIVLKCGTGTSMTVSTASGAGFGSTATISPLQTQASVVTLNDCSIIITGACTLINTALVYPIYCWVAIFRSDYSNRYCIAFIEYEIPTPSSGAYGINSTFNTTGSMNKYNASRILVPNNNAASPSYTVVSSITIQQGWILGAEILFPTNVSGNTTITVNTINSGGSASSITYDTLRPYARFLGGFGKGTAITISTI